MLGLCMVGENPTPYGILVLWAVNGLLIVYWVLFHFKEAILYFELHSSKGGLNKI